MSNIFYIMYCPSCNKDAAVERLVDKMTLNLHGYLFEVDINYYKCAECQMEFELPDPSYDPLEMAYREYERRTGKKYVP